MVTFTALSILILSACNHSETNINDQREVDLVFPGAETVNYVQTIYNSDGELQSIIKGKKESIYDLQVKQRIYVDNLEVLYKSIDEKTGEEKNTKLSSKRGALIVNKNDNEKIDGLEAWGDVVIIKQGGERIETQRIFWDHVHERIYTKENELVTIFRSDGTITKGRHLEADKSLNSIKLDNPITSAYKDMERMENF